VYKTRPFGCPAA